MSGRVTSAETRQPIAGAEVRLEAREDTHALTDEQGRFLLLNVPRGPQVLRVEHIGYAVVRRRITVPAAGTLTVEIELAESALRMEGITVTADPTGRARGELASASVIETEAIRNQAAVSLDGVLELMPGGELSAPGLSSLQQVGLRAAPTTNLGALSVANTRVVGRGPRGEGGSPRHRLIVPPRAFVTSAARLR